MKIHEYQAKEIFVSFGVTIPRGKMVTTVQEAVAVAEEFGYPVAVKSQVLVGGRGKAGGIKLAKNKIEAEQHAESILGLDIKGLTVERLLIEEGVDIAQEFYVGVIVDRTTRKPTFMVSAEGGVEIEEVARQTPERIKKLSIDPFSGIFDFQARELASFLTDDFQLAGRIANFIKNLYRSFTACDASLAEINPLVVTKDGQVIALDAKINLDDNGLYRHQDYEQLRDKSEEGPSAAEARQMGLSYIPLEGNIACVVNGAGLAMCTMDLIKYYGGEPANFLDIGGSSSPAKVTTAMKIVRAQGNADALLFNIFGGITRCDDVANGIKEAFAGKAPELPIVCRLTGTNEEKAKEIMASINIPTLTDMDEAVQKVVAVARGR